MKLLFIFLLVANFGITAWADTAKEVPTGFCFPPETSLLEVQQNLSGYILERDLPKIRRLPNNCLELPLNKGRKELFERFLGQRYVLTKVYQEGQAELPMEADLEGRKSCQMELHKETTVIGNDFKAGVQHRRGLFKNEVANQTQREVSMLMLMSGIPGSISTEKDIIYVTCQVTASGRFILSFSLSGVTGGLSTTIETAPGQRISLGRIVQDLKGKDKAADINSGVTYHTSDGGKTVQYWLQIK